MRYDYMTPEDWLCFGGVMLLMGFLVWTVFIKPLIDNQRPESMYNKRDDDGIKTAFGHVWSDKAGRWVRRRRKRKD